MFDLNVKSYVKKNKKKTETWLNNIVKIKTNDYDFVFVFAELQDEKNKIGALKKVTQKTLQLRSHLQSK